MKTIVSNYLSDLAKKYSSETSSEYSYRTEFEQFLNGVFDKMGVSRIDHDAKSKGGNKPDFVIVKNQIPILYIETKDVDLSLDKVEKSEQMARYFGYANLILTDYVEFRFYRNGIAYGEPIRIADTDKKSRIFKTLHEDKFEQLVRRMLDFTKSHKEPIKSGVHLAKIMGGKAQRIRNNIREYLKDESRSSNETLKVYQTLKKLLVHDLTLENFADMYAQTIVYGLFVARFHDDSPDSFTRQEARDLIPNSNPFLRHFFDHIVGPNFDKRLEYIVDELCEVFSHSDIEKLMHDFYKKSSKSKTTHDPVIHFYEDFLKEYDPDLRKKMGAYYTPTPVVRFMTRSVDYLLKKEFGLKKGLADTTKLKDGKTHRVQVLDPAVGTGTFISGVIREIYKNFTGQQGRWPKYVHNDLLPRIHGFELMMAPYTIAHLKLGMAFKETGFKYFNKRLGIYLTNSLENDSDQQELFSAFGLADSIAQESKEAQKIKNETPIMVVIGNPPYSGESSNAFYTDNDIYKQEPGGGKLQERNSKWINDDYVKFFRLAESMIEKTNEGIVCMITAHGYIDNPTFRGMRWHLMKTFDSIYVLDLHGNSNKKEVSPDGSKDENVFNIKTGVSIYFGVKKANSKKDLADIYKADLYGKREIKFEHLEKASVKSIDWNEVPKVKPNYAWVIRDEKKRSRYMEGFSVNELFPLSTIGIVTSRDYFVIDWSKSELANRISRFVESETVQQAKNVFNVRENKRWKIKDVLDKSFDNKKIHPISYRPFDDRYIYYDDSFIERSRRDVMSQMLGTKNIAMLIKRQGKQQFSYIFCTNKIAESCMFESAYANNTVAPLYTVDEQGNKTVNLNEEILSSIKSIVGNVIPEEVFDFVYAYLHSTNYRNKYDQFLKIDFPRVPYPTDKVQFKTLAKLGSQLRNLHLMEQSLDSLSTTFPEIGSDEVELSPEYKNGNVYINNTQYFGNVPEIAWNFYIGGYQPAQKWLKDRKGKVLTGEEIDHYQRIIVVLVETQKLMKKIDEVIEL
jgi:predicted helicase